MNVIASVSVIHKANGAFTLTETDKNGLKNCMKVFTLHKDSFTDVIAYFISPVPVSVFVMERSHCPIPILLPILIPLECTVTLSESDTLSESEAGNVNASLV